MSKPITTAPFRAFGSFVLRFGVRTAGVAVLVLYLWSIYDFINLVYTLLWHRKEWQVNWGTYWILIDLVFIATVQYRYGKRGKNTHLPQANETVVRKIISELENRNSVTDVEKYIEGWFFGTSPRCLKRGDVMEWTACMCFNTRLQDLTASQSRAVELLMKRLEKILGYKLQEGFDQSTKKMLLTLDPVSFCHRPLFFYVGIKAADWSARAALWRAGFARTTEHGMVTYLKKGSSAELPLVFFHGIGVGLFPYVRLVLAMRARFPDRTIILFEKSSISMRLSCSHLLPEDYARKIKDRLVEMDIHNVVVCGHSMGTVVICWLDHFYPGLIHGRLYLDPICFSLWTHDIAINFVYRKPGYLRHYLLKYIASLEPGIALYIRRYFVWHQNTYFSAGLPTNCKIYLSENDDIVNTPYVSSYLERHPHSDRSHEISAGVRHGELLLSGNLTPLLDDIERLSK
ncbi:hypothetical protein HDV03_002019 [Kappamyces sp. JEL0829]|nr:hypothetical protein HDV03_002019 [Kappamyces sp. JEL0829]